MSSYTNIPATSTGGVTWTTATLGSDGTDLAVSGLTGDSDGGYEIWLYAEPATGAGTPSLYFQPNNLATNQESLVLNGNGTTVTSGLDSTGLRIGSIGDAGVFCHAHIIFDSVSGRNRHFSCEAFNNNVGGVLGRQQLVTDGIWTATATVMTGFRIHSAGNMKGTNTFLKWRALNRGF